MLRRSGGRGFSAFAGAVVAPIVLSVVAACGAGPTNSHLDSATVMEWPAPNHDDSNTRALPSSTINARNIGTSGVRWTAAVAGNGVFGALGGMNPIVRGGTAYFQDLRSNVYAVDAKTGVPKWKREFNADTIGPNGASLDGGRLFVTTSLSRIAALDARDGRELWSKTIANSDTQGITTQIAAQGGTVYFSTVPVPTAGLLYPPGGMGVLYALDEQTGDVKWSFNTVKNGDLWGHPEVNSGGGAWYPPAIDADSGMTFWGTGNPAPFPGTATYPNGSSRVGPNLYTDSMVAVDKSGRLKWYRQITPHDLFDFDFDAPPILTSATMNGAIRRIVIGAGKAGRVVAFDAGTGDVLWNVSVGAHKNDETTSLPAADPVVVSPGFAGGVMSPMALSGEFLYVPVADTLAAYTSTRNTDYLGGTGELLALDVRDGHVVWKAELAAPVYAGATVMGELVLTATTEGQVEAFDAKTGNEIWAWHADGGVNAPLAVTGDSIVVPVGIGPSPKVVSLQLPRS